jgi:hypothetical protein
MASSESRRRKQLEKKKTKRAEKRHEIKVRNSSGLAEQLKRRITAPVYECLVASELESQGLGDVLISRRAPLGEVALGLFLVDRYCMGVKDCFGRICTGSEYRGFKENMTATGRVFRKIDPASARRVIEDAVAFASGFDIKPHPDFQAARQILGDIDSSQATQTFEMGRGGKPFFISGPYQSPAECRTIVAKLTDKCGPDGFDFISHAAPSDFIMPGSDFEQLGFEADFEDDEEFDEEDDVTELAMDEDSILFDENVRISRCLPHELSLLIRNAISCRSNSRMIVDKSAASRRPRRTVDRVAGSAAGHLPGLTGQRHVSGWLST